MPEKVYIDLEELLEAARGTDAYFRIKSIVSGLTLYTVKDADTTKQSKKAKGGDKK